MNRALLPSVAVALAASVSAGPLAAALPDKIPYATVDEAMNALMRNPAVELRKNGEWTIAVDREAVAIWSFVPRTHPAWPSVVRRASYAADGENYVKLDLLCGGPDAACTQLANDFKELDAQFTQALHEAAAAVPPSPAADGK